MHEIQFNEHCHTIETIFQMGCTTMFHLSTASQQGQTQHPELAAAGSFEGKRSRQHSVLHGSSLERSHPGKFSSSEKLKLYILSKIINIGNFVPVLYQSDPALAPPEQ